MIAALTGRLASKAPTHITVDVQGVGYEVQIPLSTYYGLPDLNQTTSLHIHTHLREDAIQLYGFLTSQEKGAFVLLTGISGIGPKLALSVLSALTVSDLVSAIRAGDVDKPVSVPGIGTKSAGRMVLELKDKVERLHPGLVRDSELASGTSSQIVDDAQSALVNLGYRTSDVSQAVKRLARSSAEPLPLKDLIRAVLKELTGGV